MMRSGLLLGCDGCKRLSCAMVIFVMNERDGVRSGGRAVIRWTGLDATRQPRGSGEREAGRIPHASSVHHVLQVLLLVHTIPIDHTYMS